MKTTPKDFFLHLGVIVALFVSTISLLTLLFRIINISFPDQLEYYFSDPYSAGIRWSIASLLIVFPLYVLLSWLLNRNYVQDPAKRDLWIRKWLIYITLFVAGVTLVINLITLINYFLGGEITTRFILKVLAVLIIAMAVFGYYLYDVRRNETNSRLNKIMAISSLVVIIASIVGGFVIMGSPQTVRLMRFDERKINDLQNIQWQIVNYWQQKHSLPLALTDLSDPISNYQIPLDPQTGVAYDYRVLGPEEFELCADFNLANRDNTAPAIMRPTQLGDVQQNWEHETGYTCFTRTIDQERYPLIPIQDEKLRP